jgi:Ca-activated chloride channel homolog
MSFLAPFAFAFAATIPVVVLFYLLKRKRVVRLVSSTLLWQKFLSDTQANAPFQKLRHNWLLVLQILLLLLAILALARPYFAGDAKDGALLVVILDGSASMQSTDESPNRFEKARTEALALVNGMKDHDQMVLLVAAGQTEVKQSPTSEKTSLRRALGEVAPADSPTRLVEALKLAETLIKNRANSEIHLFSDGAVRDLSEFENRDLPVVYHRVGQRGSNTGIVALDVRANPDDARQRAVFVSVANHSTNLVSAELQLQFNDRVVENRTLALEPKETSPQVFLAAQSEPGVFTVKLTTQDDLAADNQASIVSLLPRPVKVHLVTRGNRFLERALRAVPGVELTTAANLTDSAKGQDVVVLDAVDPVVWPEPNVLAISVAHTNWFDSVGRVEGPAIVDWKATHPLLRYCSFDNVQVAEALAVKPSGWGLTLVEAPQTPLLVAGEAGRQRAVWIGFDTLQSTWPLRVSFPIFIANAVEWLNPQAANSAQLMVRAGDPFRVPLTEPLLKVDVTLPGGAVKAMNVETNAREIVFGETTKQGIYKLRAGTNDTAFCVNLMDSAESDTAPRDELKLGQHTSVAATTMRRANVELWRWLAAAALAVLMFEWWYYHRRTV